MSFKNIFLLLVWSIMWGEKTIQSPVLTCWLISFNKSSDVCRASFIIRLILLRQTLFPFFELIERPILMLCSLSSEFKIYFTFNFLSWEIKTLPFSYTNSKPLPALRLLKTFLLFVTNRKFFSSLRSSS